MILSYNAISQDNQSKIISLESNDAYILKAKLVEEVTSFKYANCYARKRIKTFLYRIQIDQIIHVSDTLVYKNSELSKVKYALFEKKPSEQIIIGTFYNSECKQCLMFNRTLETDPMNATKYYQHAVIVGLSSCRNNKNILKAIAKYELKRE